MIRVAICDDDIIFVHYLEDRLREVGLSDSEVEFYEYLSGEELISEFKNNIDYDLLILDVQMGGMNGNQTAQKFREKYLNTILVFCSGVYKPTPASFKVTPFRYFLKQYSKETMVRELKDVVEIVKSRKKRPCIVGYYFSNAIELKPEEILYISIAKRGSSIHTCPDITKFKFGDRITCKQKVHELYEILKNYSFAYAHNSYIVNLSHIKSKTLNEIEMINGEVLTISRSKRKEFKDKMADFFENKYN